jgi:branched-chain amino acid transport system ATP-binding protein
MALLEVSDIRARYGAIEALKGVSLTVEEGEVVTLIGSNGAGKSTTLRSISGLTPASAGTVVFDGEDITRVPAHEIVVRGIALSPEGRHCFARMTVRENLELGAHRRAKGPDIGEDLDRVFTLFPRLQERERQKAGTMSGGEQQMLAIGRALMARPKLLMLDEPSMGIAPILVARIYETIGEINKSGVACSRPGAWRCWASRPSCATIPRSRGRTWAHDRLRADRSQGAVPAVSVAAVGGRRRLDRRPQGLRRARGADVRAAADGDRFLDRAAAFALTAGIGLAG